MISELAPMSENEILKDRLVKLEIELRHLQNDYAVTKDENKQTMVKYLEIMADLERTNQELENSKKEMQVLLGEVKTKNEELQKAQKKLKELASTDELTKLINRRVMLEHINEELVRYERNQKNFCIAIADLDNFKEINDSYGHNFGDEVLFEAASLFKSMIRKQDIVARWGGEEFLFLLPETDINGGIIICDKIRSHISRLNLRYKGSTVNFTVTFGICEFKGTSTIMETISCADNYLYKGKNTGKNVTMSCVNSI